MDSGIGILDPNSPDFVPAGRGCNSYDSVAANNQRMQPPRPLQVQQQQQPSQVLYYPTGHPNLVPQAQPQQQIHASSYYYYVAQPQIPPPVPAGYMMVLPPQGASFPPQQPHFSVPMAPVPPYEPLQVSPPPSYNSHAFNYQSSNNQQPQQQQPLDDSFDCGQSCCNSPDSPYEYRRSYAHNGGNREHRHFNSNSGRYNNRPRRNLRY